REQLQRLRCECPAASILLLGHTHRAWAVSETREQATGSVPLDGGPWLLNPGSVGQSRDWSPRGRCLLLDLEQGRAQFHRFAYDVARCRRDLRQAGLPPRSCHLLGLARRGARILRKLAGAPGIR
ncbi:MAG TPA: metallophosphoesterase family protein, partial [Armatimonadota bacterium]|nr:metallophosphoesterase family protein [Armatimonadota bacterium]